MDRLPSAIIKLSWKTDANGAPLTGCNVEGGLCGTAFSLSSGQILTATHHLRNLWRPKDGFDDFDVWIAHPDGTVHVVAADAVQPFDGFDISQVNCQGSPTVFSASTKPYDEVEVAQCIGYEANTAPFTCAVADNRVTISEVDLAKVLLPNSPQPVERGRASINGDVVIDDKLCYVVKQPATIGLSGGPMVDPEDGRVLAVCCFGLPPDEHKKEIIGAVDIRALPILNAC